MDTKKFIIHLGWIAAFISLTYAVAQVNVSTPAAVNGCVFYTTPPTLSNGQTFPFTCDSSGNLNVKTH